MTFGYLPTSRREQRGSPHQGKTGLWGKMKVKCTMKGSSPFRVKCAGLWAAGTAGLGEGHRGLPHPVRSDQSRTEVHLCGIHGAISVLFEAYQILSDLMFMFPFHFLLLFRTGYSWNQSIYPYMDKDEWVVRVLGFKFFLFLSFWFLCVVCFYYTVLFCIYHKPIDVTIWMQKVFWSQLIN